MLVFDRDTVYYLPGITCFEKRLCEKPTILALDDTIAVLLSPPVQHLACPIQLLYKSQHQKRAYQYNKTVPDSTHNRKYNIYYKREE